MALLAQAVCWPGLNDSTLVRVLAPNLACGPRIVKGTDTITQLVCNHSNLKLQRMYKKLTITHRCFSDCSAVSQPLIVQWLAAPPRVEIRRLDVGKVDTL